MYPEFDASILKSDIEYTSEEFEKIKTVYLEYGKRVQQYAQDVKIDNTDEESRKIARQVFQDIFVKECNEICPNAKRLCNIVIDLCYTNNKSKQFAWDLCGSTILSNLLEKNNMTIKYPAKDANGDIVYCGERFSIQEKVISGGDI